jgi:hypothetical protein
MVGKRKKTLGGVSNFYRKSYLFGFYRYTVEGVSYTRLEDQSLPLSTPKVHNKFGIDDG